MTKELLTNSERSCLQQCPKKYYYQYVLLKRPRKTPDALRFGSLLHGALEQWYTNYYTVDPVNRSIAAEKWLNEQLDENNNAFEIVKAQELMRGYAARYLQQEFEIEEPEAEYRAPLMNPATGAVSKTFDLGGKLDVPSRVAFLEHKSTSESIAPDSDYWTLLNIDGQISGYFYGSEFLGYDVNKAIYDVIHKIALIPFKATPMDKRRYTKKDNKLDARQHEEDETPGQYAVRCKEAIEENPDKYFARIDVHRTDEDMIEYMRDVWAVSKEILYRRQHNIWPRNPKQCLNYGRCSYLDVCGKTANINDEHLFVTAERKHMELSLETNNS